jgi:flagellar hook-length control protein FliK
MAGAAHRPTEIALSPQELGRVRMSVIAEDGAITVNILTERPETLDLMRRHIDQLGQTFRAMGYDSINFAFGQGSSAADQNRGDQQHSDQQTSDTGSDELAEAAPRETTLINLDTASLRGVDIRL